MTLSKNNIIPSETKKTPVSKMIKRDSFFYLLLLPALVITFIFAYMPLPGLIVAFEDYDIFKGMFGSPWVGLKHIKEIFEMPAIMESIWNTLTISVLSLIVAFPAPIILALLLNELKDGLFKRTIQTVSYLPHFLSWISVIGIVSTLYAAYGPINDIRVALFGEGTERILFLAQQNLFVPNVLMLTVWKDTGWGSIIYLATLSSIDPQLYEAAYIDGASRWQQARYITLPGLMPTAMLLLILRLGGLFASNFELIYGLQNPFINYEVISTVVFKSGIQQGNYSLSTALGFVQGLLAFLLTAASNSISKRLSGIAIW